MGAGSSVSSASKRPEGMNPLDETRRRAAFIVSNQQPPLCSPLPPPVPAMSESLKQRGEPPQRHPDDAATGRSDYPSQSLRGPHRDVRARSKQPARFYSTAATAGAEGPSLPDVSHEEMVAKAVAEMAEQLALLRGRTVERGGEYY